LSVSKPDKNQSLKTALITGASKRIGKAMALSAAKAGYRIGVHYHSSACDANKLCDDINQLGGNAIAVHADLTREDDTAQLIEATATALRAPLTLLINSASIFENDEIASMTRASWDMHMNANLRAPVKLTQDFASQAIANENNLVLNIIDQRVKKLTPQFMSYTASKAALMTMTITMAQALGPKKIRVNAIGPGPTLRNKRQSQEDWQKQNTSTILGVGATPHEITDAMHYFINAKSVTGQMIAVDGGQHLAWQTPDAMINE